MVWLLIGTACILTIFYFINGRLIDNTWRISRNHQTPACANNDGIDFIPAKVPVLFGHHFSSIAGAGPIVGPILAAGFFGWGPTWLWIVLGSLLVGGIHDFGSTFLSIRTGGKTIAECCKSLIGTHAGKLFSLFLILTLTYVLVVFLDLTALSFVQSSANATASVWYIICAIGLGFFLRLFPRKLGLLTLVFVPLTMLGFFVANILPSFDFPKIYWVVGIVGYCFVAAVLPVSVLLQPRDYLSSFFLYTILLGGAIGLIFLQPSFPEDCFFTGFTHPQVGSLFPFLFITVACGACSGFHSIVSSGTTSKQIKCETDIRKVSYGGMLLEAFLATLALICMLAVWSEEGNELEGSPVSIFAGGFGIILSSLGISAEYGVQFGLLAIATFLLTTLDTCTRLARFIVEEFLGKRNAFTRYGVTAIILIPSLLLSLQEIDGKAVWKAVWPLFGATNQLIAAISLITLVMFLKKNRLSSKLAIFPALLMSIVPIWGLVLLFLKSGINSLVGSIAAGMVCLGLFLIVYSFQKIIKPAL